MSTNPTDDLVKAITSLMQREYKAFSADQLALRLASVEEDSRFRYDPVARNIHAIVAKVAAKNPQQVITAAEVAKLYNELESLNPNSEFAQVHSDLFPETPVLNAPTPEVPASVNLARHDYIDLDKLPGEEDSTVIENEELAPAAVEPVLASHSSEQHRYARIGISKELESFGAANVRLAHKADTTNLMVYTATFSLPTGNETVVVPVTIEGTQLLNLPMVFGSLDGNASYEFSQEGFDKFKTDVINKIKTSGKALAESLRVATNGDDASRPASPLSNFINDEVEMPATPGLEDVEAVLANAVARKQSRYAGGVINVASETIAKELTRLGQYGKLTYAGDANNGDMLFATKFAANRKALNVVIPVEVKGTQVLYPASFKVAEKEFPLDRSGIDAAFTTEVTSVPYIADQTLSTANYNTMRHVVYASCVNKDYDKAAEALSAIRSKFGEAAFAAISKDYQHWTTTSSSPVVAASGKMSQDDWAVAFSNEMKSIVGSDGKTTDLGMNISFDKQEAEPYSGEIVTNRIELT